MKKQSNLSRLMGYAGGHKILTYLSWVLSVMSALLAQPSASASSLSVPFALSVVA